MKFIYVLVGGVISGIIWFPLGVSYAVQSADYSKFVAFVSKAEGLMDALNMLGGL